MPREIRSLTGLRAVAVLCAVVAQVYAIHRGLLFASFPGRTSELLLLDNITRVGADVFFCLSGLVLTYRYGHRLGERLDRAALGRYIIARAARIYPVYLVALLLTYAVLVVAQYAQGSRPSKDLLALSFLRQALLVQTWRAPTTQGISWIEPATAVSALVLSSVAFPFLILALHRGAQAMSPVARFVIAVTLPLPVSLLVIGLGAPAPAYMWLLRLAVYFVAGMFLAEVLAPARPAGDSGAAPEPSYSAWSTLTASLLGVVLVGIVIVSLLVDVNDYGLLAWVAVPLVAAAAAANRISDVLLGNRYTVALGRTAYAFAMIQAPILLATAAIVPNRWAAQHVLPYLALLAMGAAVAWALAFSLRAHVELPALRTFRQGGTTPESVPAPDTEPDRPDTVKRGVDAQA